MIIKKQVIIYALALVVILAGVFAYNKYHFKTVVVYLPGVSSPTEDSTASSTIDDYNSLMAKGLEYKAKGDAGDSDNYDRAIEAFLEVIKISEEKYWLPFLNLGSTYRAAGNFTEAEKAFARAMEISGGGEITVYQAKIDSWRIDPSKTPGDIKDLYEEAIEKVLDKTNLIKGYAGYLRDRGDNKEAIEQFKILSEMFPENNAYKEEIKYLGEQEHLDLRE